jgi:hypothetical protein
MPAIEFHPSTNSDAPGYSPQGTHYNLTKMFVGEATPSGQELPSSSGQDWRGALSKISDSFLRRPALKVATAGLALTALVGASADSCEIGTPPPAAKKSCAPMAAGQPSHSLEGVSFEVVGGSKALKTLGIENAALSNHSALLYSAEVTTLGNGGDCSSQWSARTDVYGEKRQQPQGPSTAHLTTLIVDTQVRPTSEPEVSCPSPGINATVADLTTGKSASATLELEDDHSGGHDCVYGGSIGDGVQGLEVTRGNEVIVQMPAEAATSTGATVPQDKQQMTLLDSDNKDTTSTHYR